MPIRTLIMRAALRRVVGSSGAHPQGRTISDEFLLYDVSTMCFGDILEMMNSM